MLKKKDLAKEFELIVKQEIKNHNDAVLASNVKINSFEKRLNNRDDIFLNHFEKIRNEINQLHTSLSCLNNKHNTTFKEIHNNLKKVERELQNLESKKSAEEKFQRVQKLENKQSEFENLVNQIKESLWASIDGNHKFLCDEVTRYKKVIEQDMCNVKMKYDSSISTLERKNKELQSEIELQNRMIVGLKDSLNKERENHWKWEKKIEYLLEQDKRLKNKKR